MEGRFPMNDKIANLTHSAIGNDEDGGCGDDKAET